MIAALSVAGLPATPFTFLGYAPRSPLANCRAGSTSGAVPGRPSCFSTRRAESRARLSAIAEVDGTIELVVCRELTKLFEQIVRGSAAEIVTCFEDGTIPEKGEFVIVARSVAPDDDVDVDGMLRYRLAAGEGPNQAAKSVATETGMPKSDLYKRALELRAEDQSG